MIYENKQKILYIEQTIKMFRKQLITNDWCIQNVISFV